MRVNWGQWGCEGQGNCADRATEIYNNIVRDRYMWSSEDQMRNLDVKFYVSGTSISKRNGDRDGGDTKRHKRSRVLQPWWQRDGGEGRHLEPVGITDWRVYGSCLVNIFTAEY